MNVNKEKIHALIVISDNVKVSYLQYDRLQPSFEKIKSQLCLYYTTFLFTLFVIGLFKTSTSKNITEKSED